MYEVVFLQKKPQERSFSDVREANNASPLSPSSLAFWLVSFIFALTYSISNLYHAFCSVAAPMNFANFPSEVLDHILCSFDVSYLIVELWKCGNRLLIKKLSECVTSVNLKRDRGARMKPPRLLAQLSNLRRLSIYAYNILFRSPLSWPALISSLPSSLKAIRLASVDARFAFKNFAPDWTDQQPKYILTTYERGSSEFIDLAKLFPHLEELKIGESYGAYMVNDTDLAALPSTLTTLETSAITLNESTKGILPRSLRHLRGYLDPQLPRGTIDPELFKSWRDALPELEEVRGIPLNCLDASWLPVTVKIVRSEFYSLDAHLALSLPPFLQTLTVNAITAPNWQDLLPQGLVKLEMGELRILPRLPDSIRAISCQRPFDCFLDGTEANNSPLATFWPSKLVHLEILSLRDSLESRLKSLPATLKHLAVDMGELRSLDGSLLPPHLTSLDVYSGGQGRSVSLSSLPPSLTSFFGTYVLLDDDVALPNALREIDFHPLRHSDSLVRPPWNFPRTLTKLVAYQWAREWMQYLPNSLETMNIKRLIRMTYLPNITADQVFKSLPPNLTYLCIHDDDRATMENFNEVFTEDCFSSLPPLIYLSMLIQGFFPSGVLRHMPKTLKVLDLKLKSITPEHAAFIPPRLTTCSLRGLDWLEHPFLGDFLPLSAIEFTGSTRNCEAYRRFLSRRDRLMKDAQPE